MVQWFFFFLLQTEQVEGRTLSLSLSPHPNNIRKNNFIQLFLSSCFFIHASLNATNIMLLFIKKIQCYFFIAHFPHATEMHAHICYCKHIGQIMLLGVQDSSQEYKILLLSWSWWVQLIRYVPKKKKSQMSSKL